MKLDAVISDRGEEVMVTKESEHRIMKEGDYLRQRVVLDDIDDDDDGGGGDDDVVIHDEDVKKKSGCLPRPSSAPADHRHVSEPTSTTHHHHSSLTDKLLKLFCAPSAHPATTSPPPCRGTARQRRRFMRVVKDEHAPPPERVTDNPNIICRYSQEYLTRHYAAVERERGRHSDSYQPTLPYITSGHTILKKSSTDPTDDRCVTPTSLKHTTFYDLVTVVDSDCEVHEERLRHTENDADDDEDSVEGSPPSQSGFFLSQPEPDSAATDEVDGALPEPCPAVQKDEVVEEKVLKDVNSVGLMNIFSTAATMELECDVSAQSPDEPKRKTSGSLPTTKHVKLVELMAQMRADDDAERS